MCPVEAHCTVAVFMIARDGQTGRPAWPGPGPVKPG
jgi:hypothetical protein